MWIDEETGKPIAAFRLTNDSGETVYTSLYEVKSVIVTDGIAQMIMEDGGLHFFKDIQAQALIQWLDNLIPDLVGEMTIDLSGIN